MQITNSPLFTHSQLTITPSRSNDGNGPQVTSLLPQLPEKPSAQTSSIQLYIIPTEKNLFIEGFGAAEYAERPPTLLRGCLYMRVLKPSKIKSISLTFRGQQRTEWPEGIPPKKTVYAEINDVISHTWPFYSCEGTYVNGGADFYQELSKKHTSNDLDVSHLSLEDSSVRSSSPAPSIATITDSSSFFARNLSPVNLIRRAASPIQLDTITSNELHNVLSMEADGSKSGNFPPGDYMYNFEHPLHPSIPETTLVTFGSVNYELSASIVRAGTFKSNLAAKLPIQVVRVPSEHSLEENEPIVITRDWEDQLRYEIIIASKSVILDSYLPLAFRFIPLLGKVSLHRIRVYLTEDLEYFCHDKKVHRSEPQKKFLLLEHKALKGQSILSKSGGLVECENAEDDEVLPREMEFQVYIPKAIHSRISYKISPDTSYENIKAHHWLKICLRISKNDPENPGKKKHFEISIDSPIHLLSPLAAHGNTLLPAYDKFREEDNFLPIYSPSSPPLSPGVIPVEGNGVQTSLPHSTQGGVSLDEIMSQPQQIEFQHLNSASNNDEPIERDITMHLDANLYKPDQNDSNPALYSPQATPHFGSFSPMLSPVQGHLPAVRRPTINPPPFNADQLPVESIPPPAYVKEDPSSKSNYVNKKNSISNNSNYSSTSKNHDEVSANGYFNGDNENSTFLKITPPSPKDAGDNREAFCPREENDTNHNASTTDFTNISHYEEDIVDMPSSPRHLPAVSPIRSHSRRSSDSSSTSSTDLPMEQTFPLLSPSSLSLHNPGQYKSRNSSMNSFGESRRVSHAQGNPTKITDLVDSALYSGDFYQINGNLSNLRNPRIKKHYHDEIISQDRNDTEEGKNRQKSIGVVNSLDFSTHKSNSSTESDTTITKEQLSSPSKSETLEHGSVPGLNFSYAIQ